MKLVAYQPYLKKKRIAAIVSENGHLFQAIVDATKKNIIQGRVVVVITVNSKAYVRKRAKKENIPCFVIKGGDKMPVTELGKEILKILDRFKVDLVFLTFTRLLSDSVVNKYKNQCMNVHLAMRPAFAGFKTREKILEYGVRYMGATVHFVDTSVDKGPVISQFVIPVTPFDTIKSISKEYLINLKLMLLNAIDLFCQDRIKVKGRKVIIKDAVYRSYPISPKVEKDFTNFI